MKLLRLSIFLILIVPAIAAAQSKKIPVAVVHKGKDSVGQGVAFALKEAIRGSQSFFLLDHEPLPKRARMIVAKRMRADLSRDAGAVGQALDDSLNGLRVDVERIVDSVPAIEKRERPVGEWHDAALPFGSEGPSLAVNDEPLALEGDVLTRKARELSKPKAGVEQGIADSFSGKFFAALSNHSCPSLVSGSLL